MIERKRRFVEDTAVGTYERYSIRLRFEAGQLVPEVGMSWTTETALGHQPCRVRLLKIKRTFEHPREPGVTLMDAYISRSML